MVGLAFDRASVRRYDHDGRLHVAVTKISKAAVNPYRGKEIPGWERLGLDPDRIYQLLRDPAELEKAASTFNNLPILNKHVPVSAEEPEQDSVVGSTGTDAAFDGPYLLNSAVVWVQDSIDLIESDRQKEWSCAYRYVADMTPGTYEGLRYDGIMRNLIGNHVALVEEGRAGSDCVVGDSKSGMPPMALKSRKALMVSGAIRAHLAPLLAQDAKIDLTPILADVTRANFSAKAPGIAAAVVKACEGKLAADADLSDLPAVIDAFKTDAPEEAATDEETIDNDDNDPPKEAEDEGDDLGARIMAALRGKVSDDVLAEIATMCGAGGMDEDPDDKDKKDDKEKPAMDAATIQRRAVAQVQAIATAREAVEPIVGKVAASVTDPAKIYELAFDHMSVPYKGAHASAYPVMLELAKQAQGGKPALAQDSARDAGDAAARFAKANPTAAPLVRS